MADNVAFTPGTGATGAADDIGGVYYPRVKLALGADGTAVDCVGGSGAAGTGVVRTVAATDSPDVTKLNAMAKSLEGDYETVAASQTAQVLGATGATGDFISHVLVIPASVNPGNVILLDNATAITIFAGGSSSVSNLVPFAIPLNMVSVSGAWKLTTGANVSAIGVGSFT